jgi:ribosome-binding protein aMBF1 (putative translation factor)
MKAKLSETSRRRPASLYGMPTTTIAIDPDRFAGELRERRQRLGLSRARLAGLARCSVTSIDNLEAGYVPERSAVLFRVLAVLDEIEDATPERAGEQRA